MLKVECFWSHLLLTISNVIMKNLTRVISDYVIQHIQSQAKNISGANAELRAVFNGPHGSHCGLWCVPRRSSRACVDGPLLPRG